MLCGSAAIEASDSDDGALLVGLSPRPRSQQLLATGGLHPAPLCKAAITAAASGASSRHFSIGIMHDHALDIVQAAIEGSLLEVVAPGGALGGWHAAYEGSASTSSAQQVNDDGQGGRGGGELGLLPGKGHACSAVPSVTTASAALSAGPLPTDDVKVAMCSDANVSSAAAHQSHAPAPNGLSRELLLEAGAEQQSGARKSWADETEAASLELFAATPGKPTRTPTSSAKHVYDEGQGGRGGGELGLLPGKEHASTELPSVTTASAELLAVPLLTVDVKVAMRIEVNVSPAAALQSHGPASNGLSRELLLEAGAEQHDGARKSCAATEAAYLEDASVKSPAASVGDVLSAMPQVPTFAQALGFFVGHGAHAALGAALGDDKDGQPLLLGHSHPLTFPTTMLATTTAAISAFDPHRDVPGGLGCDGEQELHQHPRETWHDQPVGDSWKLCTGKGHGERQADALPPLVHHPVL